MRRWWRCRACGGVYASTFRDGALYFHACAPEYREQLGEWVDRPGGRDENWVPVGESGRTRPRREGQGREEVPAPSE